MGLRDSEALKPLAVLIAGPTASGKSALALDLAERTDGVIINADSMQVYGDLRILTARPSPEEEMRVPHRLYGHVDGAADYSVARWIADAAAAMATARAEGRLPIVIGGTGLYFRALTRGLAPIPEIPEEVRQRVRRMAEDEVTVVLHARLATRDPEAAVRLQPQDRQRILRALEVFEATGQPLSQWQRATHRPVLEEASAVRFVLEVERETLRGRIDRRFETMMEAGALAEVERLAARELPADRTILKAHGAPALTRYLRGEMSRADAIAEGQNDTRRYAKRQVTWFRHQMPDWMRGTPDTALDQLTGTLRL
ncbi:tRNA isopentenyltransferase [Azorhizobium caulinodans ORS 571]|uniref:tRNA dimethylallyltransferase n=1 Tax=Azorhizobium caulinodans (strain ATCC 43989 / DSM 5975 / JCM 20966 / LMG 6465 / NBRC 14845 / NCIMB 13405 / ORS 571) TaxID=438753 RepID=MIAA_AZOC5|nr:tRNA (adenosine(37)-N6)-dimethylallyltransferase MiaA [Azorhizobium caulinodans]A8IAX3.1 RecName: Full=tRNA dimethylallyltransferase; AltName: Full=Dimethylallyl diphosphate:tRNA dimethylallyltransferase; Short=DMAPP:tRNA dimethylallyltransferase; Short=DMATase; AltName: Full=Isopentenyl-diphosphate:tRNA isopentenyltransferase; Short=IPP transferase; Short=IPPT; Short=IPTase [Azorhizobium caulinodans ORS 571]BAF88573.1 tRNA isopentenyltransferase [Azorhizobium caulinodans ORS 571]